MFPSQPVLQMWAFCLQEADVFIPRTWTSQFYINGVHRLGSDYELQDVQHLRAPLQLMLCCASLAGLHGRTDSSICLYVFRGVQETKILWHFEKFKKGPLVSCTFVMVMIFFCLLSYKVCGEKGSVARCLNSYIFYTNRSLTLSFEWGELGLCTSSIEAKCE